MTPKPSPPASSAPAGLPHLPLALFAVPMGIGGAGIGWREAARFLGAPAFIGEALLTLAALAWVLILALHAVRAARYPASLAADLRHPVRSAFAGALTVGLMILSGGLFPYAPGAAADLWLGAVVVHLAIGVWMVHGLLNVPREAATLTPPLLIPLVGNILAPAFGVRMGFETLCWILFGVGGLLWALIQPLILSRIISGPPLPERLRPTMVILLAPPAAGTLALANLTHGFGPGPLVLMGLAGFMAAVLATLAPSFARVPFAMSWWGWTFPTGAFAMSLLALANAYPSPWLIGLGWLALVVASVIVAVVSLATLRAAAAGHLLQPEA